jgi:glycosyltransferase involved in cell wall biosynthesis
MKTNLSLTAIILTYNEEKHLQRCLNSLMKICSDIFIIDSFSTDGTKSIAELNNVHFVQKKWVNHSVQFNWGLDNLPIATDWIIRLDADEYLTDELQIEIIEKLNTFPHKVSGIEMPRKRIFLNKEIRWGGSEVKLLRIFRKGMARVENKLMDEHIEIIEGEIKSFSNKFIDHNLSSIGTWILKHNNYADKEVIELLNIKFDILGDRKKSFLNSQAQKKRSLKLIYADTPLFLRPLLYFFYRYFLCFGFLDGKEGFLWHFFQGLWYRLLVDMKLLEIYLICGNDKVKIKKYTEEVFK